MKTIKSIKDLARDLRKNPTPEERFMWECLRNRRLGNYKFLRQHPIVYQQDQYRYLFFIADFYCAEKKLVIELDGGIHKQQKYKDQQRDLILQRLDLRVLRIPNTELEHIENVKDKILTSLNLPTPAPPY